MLEFEIQWDKSTQRPENKGKSVPIVRPPKPEDQKKHITQTGKR